MMDDLELAIRAAREAGAILLSFYHSEYEIKEKGIDNPLTEADEASDRYLKSVLRSARPDYGWLSEETVDQPERRAAARVWIVDPLDGTKEFIQGVPEFAVSIALAEDESAKLGVIYNPVSDEMYAGIVGQGATLNGNAIHTSDRIPLLGATLLASRSEMKRGEFSRFEADFTIAAVGSIAYKLARVAEGKGDATFSLGPKHEWDVGAGAALIEAAGGRVTARDGAPLRFNQDSTLCNGILAANAHLHEPLVARCRPLLHEFAHRFTERRAPK